MSGAGIIIKVMDSFPLYFYPGATEIAIRLMTFEAIINLGLGSNLILLDNL